MSLRDELEPPKTQGGRCSVRTFVESQPDPAEWIELMEDPSIQHSRLFRLMKKHGFDKSDQPVSRHRAGECGCARAKK